MNDLERIALQFIADQYGVSLRELTVGKIEDFIEQRESTIRRRKEAKEEELLKEKTENLINNSLVQNPSKSFKSADSPTEKDYANEFEGLWKKYPRKQGKKDALRHYIAARKKDVSLQTISDGLDAYNAYLIRNGISSGYVKLGSSWFCEWSWDDDYSQDFSKDRKGGYRQNLSDERALEIAEAVLNGNEDLT